MNPIKTIGLIILLVAMRTLATYGQEAHLQILFMPSFLNPSTLTITDENNQLSIVIHIHDTVKGVTEQKTIRNEEISALTKFFKNYRFTRKGAIDTISIDKVVRPNGDTVLAYKISSGLDGITVEGKFGNRTFEFWSPRKDTENHRLMEIMFGLMNKAFTKPEVVRYLEGLEQYFHLGLGLKKVKNEPLTYKLYGTISSNDEEELIEFFGSLPSDQKIIIDVSNFWGIAEMLYPHFRELVKRNREIYWLEAGEYGLEDLLEAGISPDNILR